jgi:CBS domain containing-hemolysin-like protein
MIPRQKVTFLSARDSREETRLKLTDTQFSRFPFSPTSRLDDVSGVVLARKLLFWMQDHPDQEVDWPSVMGDALIVPDSMRLDALLKTFQSERRHLAIVVDEFGSVEGIATLEDVIEEVIGEIDDETDEPIPGLSRQPDGSLQVRGGMDLRRVCSELGLEWSPELEVSTMAGLISERLSRIPVPGDAVGWRARQIRITPAAGDESDTHSESDRD